MKSWPSRSVPNPAHHSIRVRSAPGANAPVQAMSSPAAAASPSPRAAGHPARTVPAKPASATAVTTRRTVAIAHQPWPGTSASAFHTPPSMSRLPSVPNGPSARGAKAATPAGSVSAVARSAGISQGRLNSAIAPPAVARRRAPASALTGSTASAVMSMALKPPAAAGRSASSRRGTPPRAAARTAQGSPAYPSSRAQCPSSSRWAR